MSEMNARDPSGIVVLGAIGSPVRFLQRLLSLRPANGLRAPQRAKYSAALAVPVLPRDQNLATSIRRSGAFPLDRDHASSAPLLADSTRFAYFATPWELELGPIEIRAYEDLYDSARRAGEITGSDSGSQHEIVRRAWLWTWAQILRFNLPVLRHSVLLGDDPILIRRALDDVGLTGMCDADVVNQLMANKNK